MAGHSGTSKDQTKLQTADSNMKIQKYKHDTHIISAEWRCKYSCSAFRWLSTMVMVSSSTSLVSGGGGGAGMLRGVSRLSKHSGLV